MRITKTARPVERNSRMNIGRKSLMILGWVRLSQPTTAFEKFITNGV
jgi:hypothetical protein